MSKDKTSRITDGIANIAAFMLILLGVILLMGETDNTARLLLPKVIAFVLLFTGYKIFKVRVLDKEI